MSIKRVNKPMPDLGKPVALTDEVAYNDLFLPDSERELVDIKSVKPKMLFNRNYQTKYVGMSVVPNYDMKYLQPEYLPSTSIIMAYNRAMRRVFHKHEYIRLKSDDWQYDGLVYLDRLYFFRCMGFPRIDRRRFWRTPKHIVSCLMKADLIWFLNIDKKIMTVELSPRGVAFIREFSHSFRSELLRACNGIAISVNQLVSFDRKNREAMHVGIREEDYPIIDEHEVPSFRMCEIVERRKEKVAKGRANFWEKYKKGQVYFRGKRRAIRTVDLEEHRA